MRQITIAKEEAGQRLDKMLSRYFHTAPKSFLYKMLRKKNITLNGKKATGAEKLTAGDEVKLFLAEETILAFQNGTAPSSVETGSPAQTAPAPKQPEKKLPPLAVLYEDPDVLFLAKPAGVLSQKAVPSDYSINEQLLDWLLDTGRMNAEQMRLVKPSVCNRLDRNTSGLIAAGKTMNGLQQLSAMIRDRKVRKFYYALVEGRMTRTEHLKGYWSKDEATNQVVITDSARPGAALVETAWEPIATSRRATLLQIELITGKTHQIRAHLASIGHPILGDSKYGEHAAHPETRTFHVRRQMLHAARMEFPADSTLPALSGKHITAPVPADFQKVIRRIKETDGWQPGIPEDFGARPWKN